MLDKCYSFHIKSLVVTQKYGKALDFIHFAQYLPKYLMNYFSFLGSSKTISVHRIFKGNFITRAIKLKIRTGKGK